MNAQAEPQEGGGPALVEVVCGIGVYPLKTSTRGPAPLGKAGTFSPSSAPRVITPSSHPLNRRAPRAGRRLLNSAAPSGLLGRVASDRRLSHR